MSVEDFRAQLKTELQPALRATYLDGFVAALQMVNRVIDRILAEPDITEPQTAVLRGLKEGLTGHYATEDL